MVLCELSISLVPENPMINSFQKYVGSSYSDSHTGSVACYTNQPHFSTVLLALLPT